MIYESLLVHAGSQCAVLLHACLCGAAFAVFYDLFRIIRRVFRCPAALVALQDLLCCAVFCLGSFLFLLSECDGRLRWYALAGQGLGALLYRGLLGWAVVGAGAWALRLAVNAAGLLWRFASGLAAVPCKALRRLVRFALGYGRAAARKTGRAVQKKFKKASGKIKFRLKPRPVLLYNARTAGRGAAVCPAARTEKGRSDAMARKRKHRSSWLTRLAVLGFAVYVTVSLIGMQVEVTSKRRELLALQQNVEQQKLINAETERMLDGENDKEYIERIARDKLGYAYPDEKIFIDRSGG